MCLCVCVFGSKVARLPAAENLKRIAEVYHRPIGTHFPVPVSNVDPHTAPSGCRVSCSPPALYNYYSRHFPTYVRGISQDVRPSLFHTLRAARYFPHTAETSTQTYDPSSLHTHHATWCFPRTAEATASTTFLHPPSSTRSLARSARCPTWTRK